MRNQALDKNWNPLIESEAKLTSPARARLVRVKSMRLDGPRHEMEVVPYSTLYPNV